MIEKLKYVIEFIWSENIIITDTTIFDFDYFMANITIAMICRLYILVNFMKYQFKQYSKSRISRTFEEFI